MADALADSVLGMVDPFTSVALKLPHRRRQPTTSEQAPLASRRSRASTSITPVTLCLDSEAGRGDLLVGSSLVHDLAPSLPRAEPSVLACVGLGNDALGKPVSWWIQRLFEMPMSKRTGWIVSQILDNYGNEQTYVDSCGYESYAAQTLPCHKSSQW